MTNMICAQVYLPQKQCLRLKRLAKARGMSAAELIRQAVEKQIQAEARSQPVRQAPPLSAVVSTRLTSLGSSTGGHAGVARTRAPGATPPRLEA